MSCSPSAWLQFNPNHSANAHSISALQNLISQLYPWVFQVFVDVVIFASHSLYSQPEASPSVEIINPKSLPKSINPIFELHLIPVFKALKSVIPFTSLYSL